MNIREISSTIIRGEQAIKFPLKYDPMGIFVVDSNHGRVLDIRGWGRLQYHKDGQDEGAKIQDQIGEWIVATLNKEYESTSHN